MTIIGIIGNGPVEHLPNLKQYDEEIDIWIGADRGALQLIKQGITVNYAVGDFDSIDSQQKEILLQNTKQLDEFPEEKNETDLEIAIEKAIQLKPEKIYLFGVTGGRLDHTLINTQLLANLVEQDIRGIIVDRWNMLEMTKRGLHTVNKNEQYPYISFIPYTKDVKGITLKGFYYPLEDYDISHGSTRCISNELITETGTFSYEEGTLLLIQSRDV